MNPGEEIENDPLIIYLDEQSRLRTATNLVIFAVEQYHYSFLKNNLNRYLNFKTLSMEERLNAETVFPLMCNHITNCFMLCTVFENYMKAILLYRGLLVHAPYNKDNEKSKELKKGLEKQPVRLLQINEKWVKEYLHPHITIGMKLLLLPSYQKQIKLPAEILYLLKEINVPRNRLHYLTSLKLTLNDKLLNALKVADNFILVDMKRLVEQATTKK